MEMMDLSRGGCLLTVFGRKSRVALAISERRGGISHTSPGCPDLLPIFSCKKTHLNPLFPLSFYTFFRFQSPPFSHFLLSLLTFPRLIFTSQYGLGLQCVYSVFKIIPDLLELDALLLLSSLPHPSIFPTPPPTFVFHTSDSMLESFSYTWPLLPLKGRGGPTPSMEPWWFIPPRLSSFGNRGVALDITPALADGGRYDVALIWLLKSLRLFLATCCCCCCCCFFM